jgi:hypothetical protein
MAELTIAQLTELLAANVDNADLLPIWDNTASETKKITISNFRTAVGVSNWSESFSSTTQATSRWIPNNAATNVNAAIVPKGTGAIVAAIPDGTTTGGNSRGIYAVDLQITRSSSADRVAGGSYSFIGGGNNNGLGIAPFSVIVGGQSNRINDQTGSQSSHAFIGGGSSNFIDRSGPSVICGGSSNSIGRPSSFIGGGGPNTISGFLSVIVGGISNSVGNVDYASIVGGVSNTASANYATIGGGQLNTASATHTTVGGGQSNTASAAHSFIGGGQTNTASGSYSMVIGGLSANSNLYGQSSHASGQFSAQGDAQAHELIWRRAITGTATTELFLDGASVAAILPSTNSVWHGIIDISSICTAQGNGTTVTGDVAATSYKVTIKRIGTTTSLVGTVQEIGSINADVSMAAVAFIITNNDTNESLQIAFTPPPTAGSTTTIRVMATFRGTQIKY